MSPPGFLETARSSSAIRSVSTPVERQYRMRPHTAQSVSRRSSGGGFQPGAAPGESSAEARQSSRYSGATRANCWVRAMDGPASVSPPIPPREG